jgi:hypothetical protein
MPSYRKASIRELASAAYELDLGVVEGHIQCSAEDGRCAINDVEISDWLARYDGQDVIVIVASLEDDRPVPTKTCRTCGTEYTGIACPRCREARIRLRGR